MRSRIDRNERQRLRRIHDEEQARARKRQVRSWFGWVRRSKEAWRIHRHEGRA